MLFLLIILFTFGISLWATWRVKANVAKYSQMPATSGYTGAQAAYQILQAAGIQDVQIQEGEGMLGDHYDPMNKRLVLSPDNYHGNSTAALGIAAHETGHAIQHKIAYAPLHWRMAAVNLTSFASQIVMILPLIGLFTGLVRGPMMLVIMASAWGVIMLFNLITLPVEFDASRRAKTILGQMNLIQGPQETLAVNKVLNAAAWTYVAAFLTSLAYFLWHLLPLLLGGRSRD